MSELQESTTDPVRGRIARETLNIFSRLPPVYTASRQQGAKFLARCGDLSTVEWRTLWDLHEAGPMTIRQLALVQRADHSLLSRALPDMRHKGLVSMARDRSDGRQTIVALTDAGRAAYDRAAPVMARRRAALAEVFSDSEIREFVGYLDRLEAFLRLPIETHFDSKETI